MKGINSTKLKYNELLKREKKAQLYIDNPNIDIKIISEKYIPEYQKIVRELSELLNKIGSYTQEEALEGFKI